MQNKNKVVNLYDIQVFNSEGDRLKVNQVRIGKKDILLKELIAKQEIGVNL